MGILLLWLEILVIDQGRIRSIDLLVRMSTEVDTAEALVQLFSLWPLLSDLETGERVYCIEITQ